MKHKEHSEMDMGYDEVKEIWMQSWKSFKKGDYRKSKGLSTRVNEIKCKLRGKDDQSYATNLDKIAGSYISIGDYAKALSLLEESLEFKSKSLGKDHPEYADSLNVLSIVYISIADYKKAEKLLNEALEINRKSLGKNHPNYATSLNNLAGVYDSIGDYAKAEKRHKEALKIRGRSLGKNHPSYASSLNNLACVYESKGNHPKAEKLLKGALKIRAKFLGKDDLAYVQSLSNLASVYTSVGDYKNAEKLLKKALVIFSKSLGKDHPDAIVVIENLALIYYNTNRIDDAFNTAKRAIELKNSMIRNVFSITDEKQKLAYMRRIQHSIDFLLSVATISQCRGHIRFAFDTVLQRKGIVAELLTMQREQLLAERNPRLRLEFEELARLRNLTMLRYQDERIPRDLVSTDISIGEIEEKKNSLERELLKRIPEYAIESRIAAADAAAVSKLLRKGSILVEFVRFYKLGLKSTGSAQSNNPILSEEGPRYSTFICRKDAPNKLEMIDLGDAEVIDGAVAELSRKIAGKEPEKGEKISKNDEYIESRIDDLKILLEQLVLRKIEGAFEECKEIIIAPDGQLNILPFEILRCKDGKLLIDRHIVSYLGTGRDMLRVKRRIKKRQGPSKVIADPDFDLVYGSSKVKMPKDPHRRSREFERGKHLAYPLLATNFEGRFVGSILGVKPIMRGNALEGKIRKIQSPKIFHIATHGFFFKDNDWGEISKKVGKMNFDRNPGVAVAKIENPLLRSGLVLAGYNTYQRRGNLPPEAEDGTLTALDVSEMDLSGTELVVLSACGTGLGDIRAGEGVFGLRRTFALAGARTVVVSLWPVDDLATMLLMNRFYENLLKQKMPKAESLRDAQLYLRTLTGGDISKIINSNSAMREHYDTLSYEAHKAVKPFSNPRYWGAFICIGDPGPLT
jgi:CHAT domain-containing protein/Flp pilus assembly protein TadD